MSDRDPKQGSVQSNDDLINNSGAQPKSRQAISVTGLGISDVGDFAADAASFDPVERAKREWERTVDALPELICVVNDRGRLVRANLTVERWSLGSVVSVAGQDFHGFIHHDCDPSCYLTVFIDKAMEKTLIDEPVELETYDAILRRHVLIRALPIHSGDETAGRHLAIIIHDITGRKEMESALRQNNDRLKVLNAVSNAMLSAQSPEEIARIVLQYVETLVPFQQAYIIVGKPESQQFSILASANHDNHAFSLDQVVPFAAFGDKVNRCISELFLIGNLHQSDSLTPFENQMRDRGSGSYINVPLRGEEQSLGMFVVGMDCIDTFEASQIQVIREVSELLTVAIRQAQLHQKYKRTNRELQYFLRLKDRLAKHDAHERSSSLTLIRDHPEAMSDEFFSPLKDASVNAALIRDNWDDLLG